MFTFTPLYGAQSTSAASSSILEFDGGVKVLIDIGWDASFETNALKELETHVPTLSLVLLTHPTFDHIGAYAYACKHIPFFSRIPVYATIPVINLGLTLLTDLYASSRLAASAIQPEALGVTREGETPNLLLQPPSPDEIARYFNHIAPLKYSQPHQPTPAQSTPPLNGLTITAYAAGHTLGGTIWHLQHGLESIVYAADWNQTRENLLSGAAWLSSASGGAEIIEPLRRPTALICSSRGVEVENPVSRKKRDDTLISLIRDAVVQGGKVLIPTDSSARMLELAFLLNQAWLDNIDGPHGATYKGTKVYIASKSATATRRYLQSMLEWMDDSVIRNAEAAMTGAGKEKPANPLEWDHIHTIERQSQLDRALKRDKPSVILASDSSLEWGFSRHAFEKLAADPRNVVILTEMQPTSQDTIASQLWARTESTDKPDTSLLAIRVPTISKLDANEQEIYAQYIARQRALSAASGTLPGDGVDMQDHTGADIEEAASDSSDSEDEDEDEVADAQHQGRALNLSSQLASNKRRVGLAEADSGIDLLLSAKAHDYEVFGKRGRERMFPYRQTKKRDDDFGEAIIVTDYLRAEEKEEMDGLAVASVQDRKVGEKRKWDDVSAATNKAASKGRQGSHSESKRTRMQNGDDMDGDDLSGSDSDESEYEPDEADDSSTEPKKVEFTSTEIELAAKVSFVDFSARHDKRDLLMLIPLIRPRKLILIAGTKREVATLAENVRPLLDRRSNGVKGDSKKSQLEVFTPADGESVDASVDTNAWTLKLGRNLLRKLAWQDINGIGIVALTGSLSADHEKVKDEAIEEDGEDDIARKKRKLGLATTATTVLEEKEDTQELPLLDLPSSISASRLQLQSTSVNRPIHVGDLRLSDLRNLLRAAGHTADFRGEGTLLVDGIVVVRKSSGGRIEVEGNVFGTNGRGAVGEMIFGEVKRKVYQGLAVVGGGQATAA